MEEVRLADWLADDPANQKELDTQQLLFEGLALCMPAVAARQMAESPKQRKKLLRISVVSMAASVLLFLALGIGAHHYSRTIDDLSSQMTRVEIPYGQRINMTLNDGTKVSLNAGSVLEYPAVFSGNSRKVKIKGEALFDVKHDSKHPFIIETFACDVEVLGTRFNVAADEQANLFELALMQGSVKLTQRSGEGDPIIMQENDAVELLNGQLSLGKIASYDEYLWTEGIVSINNLTFDELVGKFERVYGVEIRLECAQVPVVRNIKGKLRVSEGIDHALNVLQSMADFNCRKDPATGVIVIY